MPETVAPDPGDVILTAPLAMGVGVDAGVGVGAEVDVDVWVGVAVPPFSTVTCLEEVPTTWRVELKAVAEIV